MSGHLNFQDKQIGNEGDLFGYNKCERDFEITNIKDMLT